MYIRDYNKATTLYDTDAFIVDGSQETMYILVSDLYHALIGNKGFVTEKELLEKQYQTKQQVDSNIEARGYVTAIQADKLITDKGYQTAGQVENIVEGYGYTTSSDVNRIIDTKDFITDSELESKEYQTEEQVKELIKDNSTKVVVDSELSTESQNPVQNSVITNYLNDNILFLGSHNLTDEDLDTITDDYNVPDFKPYMITRSGVGAPPNIEIIIGMEYGGGTWGFQESHKMSDRIKRRQLVNGVWRDWKVMVQDPYSLSFGRNTKVLLCNFTPNGTHFTLVLEFYPINYYDHMAISKVLITEDGISELTLSGANSISYKKSIVLMKNGSGTIYVFINSPNYNDNNQVFVRYHYPSDFVFRGIDYSDEDYNKFISDKTIMFDPRYSNYYSGGLWINNKRLRGFDIDFSIANMRQMTNTTTGIASMNTIKNYQEILVCVLQKVTQSNYKLRDTYNIPTTIINSSYVIQVTITGGSLSFSDSEVSIIGDTSYYVSIFGIGAL